MVARSLVQKTKRVSQKKLTPKRKKASVKPGLSAHENVLVSGHHAQQKQSVSIATLSHPHPEGTHKKREPLGHLLVAKLLKEAGFHGTVASDKDTLLKYSYDESIFSIRPQVVIHPKSKKDVAIAVAVVGRETKRFTSLSLTARAAGTGLGGGALTNSLVVDVCTHLKHIEEPKVTKEGLTITCEPGAMWRDVEKKLKRYDAYLPSYPASKDICTIGGAVANNAAGPDSYRHGQTASWVRSLEVVLYDGKPYTIEPITYSTFKKLTQKSNAHSSILAHVLSLLEKHERLIKNGKPKTTKNTAGYALWDVLSVPVASFKKGSGTLDLTRLFCGSQGTIGIITSITLRTAPLPKDTELVVVPIFDLVDAGKAILKARDFDPINIELFDGLTFDLALKNPQFFKDRLPTLLYYQVVLAMYTTYHIRYNRKTPDFTLLITLDKKRGNSGAHLVELLRKTGQNKARLVGNAVDVEMYWQVRRASYSLSKFQDPKKRPAAFLEDMVVPPKNMPQFFTEVKALLKKYNLIAAIHGHGGDGHLHFYPLIDFEQKTTPQLIMKMAEEFFNVAIKHGGGFCGEHNDSIISTPLLSKMFPKELLNLFEELERTCDPDDIFNPGKKVHPHFDVRKTIRHTNQNPTKHDGEIVSGPL